MGFTLSLYAAVVLYKIASLIVGLIVCYFGYRLFIAGVWGQAGDLKTKFGDNYLVLKSAAPGTFFVVLGTAIIVTTIWRGLDLSEYADQSRGKSSYQAPIEQTLPKKPPS